MNYSEMKQAISALKKLGMTRDFKGEYSHSGVYMLRSGQYDKPRYTIKKDGVWCEHNFYEGELLAPEDGYVDLEALKKAAMYAETEREECNARLREIEREESEYIEDLSW